MPNQPNTLGHQRTALRLWDVTPSKCHHSKPLCPYCIPATAQRLKPQIKVPKAGEQQVRGTAGPGTRHVPYI